ncbi:MAG: hypothetical protein RIG62_03660 [Cyclobacteriaceae bacterium]
MKKLVVLTGLSFLFTVIGFNAWEWFFKLSIKRIDIQNLDTVAYSGQFMTHLTFVAVVGLIPLIYAMTVRLGQINKAWKKTVTLSIILITAVIFWQLRIQFLQTELQRITLDSFAVLGSLNIPVYLLIGLVFGAFLSGITFKLTQHNVG